jgi:hypothetical protein
LDQGGSMRQVGMQIGVTELTGGTRDPFVLG